MLVIWGFLTSLLLFGVGRGMRTVSGTFSCGFEEMGHTIFWDSILIMIGFLVFEYEIVYLMIFLDRGVLLIRVVIMLVIVIELLSKRFAY
jgi:hypothetical protein